MLFVKKSSGIEQNNAICRPHIAQSIIFFAVEVAVRRSPGVPGCFARTAAEPRSY
jgi:hypothetical protein